MRVTFIAEYPGGVRTPITLDDVTDSEEAYRRAADMLRVRPLAHRVECWAGTQYVTRATRGVEVAQFETPSEHNRWKGSY